MKMTVPALAAFLLMTIAFPAAISAAEKSEAFLGVSIAPIPVALRSHLELKKGQGVLIAWVSPGSPAAKAGLQQYDVLLEFDGIEVATEKDIADAVSLASPNDQVNCWIVRKAKHDAIKITLGTRPTAATPIKRPKRLLGAHANSIMLDIPMLNFNFPTHGHVHAMNFMIHDGTHLTQARRDAKGELQLTVRDNKGKIVFKGPANTPEQRKKLPESLRLHLEKNQLLP